jgi:hypothetical protein
MQTNLRATDFLLELGPAEEVKDSGRGRTLSKAVQFNSHIHLPPNFSAFSSVRQALNLAARENVRVLGAGNYYDFSVYDEFARAGQGKGIFPVFGTEIIALDRNLQRQGLRVNDPHNPGKYYICGKGISRFERLSSRAAEILSVIRGNDAARMRQMTQKLSSVFCEHGIQMGLTDVAVIDRVVERHGCDRRTITLQERHLAQAFQEVFFEKVPAEQRREKLKEVFGVETKSRADDAVGVQNEIRTNLMKAGKACYVDETFVDLSRAKQLILELGGIPCYPVLADGAKQRCEWETPTGKVIDNLKAGGYSMAEFITVRNQPEVLLEYVMAVRKAGIAVIAGTEHNTLDMLPVAPRCAGGGEIPEEVNDIFREGICVLAAHAFLSAHGRCGFVDSANNPNPDYGSTEERIKDFAATGAAVLERYFQKYKTA